MFAQNPQDVSLGHVAAPPEPRTFSDSRKTARLEAMQRQLIAAGALSRASRPDGMASVVAQAREAQSACQWHMAAVLFGAAADSVPPSPHHHALPAAQALRRSARHCASMLAGGEGGQARRKAMAALGHYPEPPSTPVHLQPFCQSMLFGSVQP